MNYRIKYFLDRLLMSFVPVRKWRTQIRMRTLTDEDVVRQTFLRRFGFPLDLQSPHNYNEKLQWLMLYGRDPRMTPCADKFAVREYIKAKCGDGLLNELYGVYDTAAEIDFAVLPDAFVLKVNHGCGQNIIVTDKAKLDHTQARKKLTQWLKHNHYPVWREWCYKNIPPKIICEKYLKTDGDLVDYKIHCFNGKPHFIHVDVDRYTNHTRVFYDTQWQNQHFTSDFPLYHGEIDRPTCLSEILIAAEKLAANFVNVRIDFYVINDRPIFGEMTFFHGAGTETFNPPEWDRKLGDLIQLPNKPSTAPLTTGI